jgi:enediyne biosynthesis protein E4
VSGFVKQFLVVLLLAGLIGSVFLLKRTATPPEPLEPDEALERYGFHLREVSKEAGIEFTHQAPTLDDKLEHIMPIIASMGAAVSVVDFDRDGLPDLYVIDSREGSKNRLYRNLGNGKFKDVAEEMGVADLNRPGTGVCMGAVWGDFDNDGYEDLLVYKWGRPELFHNYKGKRFTRVTEKAGLPKWLNANSAIWVDFDRDGHLDLFLAGYWADDLDLWKLKTTKIMPESFEYARNGGRKYLLRNKGDGTFEDVTKEMGITSTRWTLGVAAADLCGSGYPDLFLANDYGVSELYANQKGKGFVEIGKRSGIAKAPKSGMNASFGDIFNQGRFSIYVSNITEPIYLLQGNNLWVPEANTSGNDIRYENQANVLDVERGGWSWGAQFGDLNNDGLLDLYLTNGYISADRDKKPYWYDYSLIAGANQAIISDAKNWPAMKGRSLAGYQQKCLWLNKGGKFVDIAQAVGATDTYDGRAVALVDLWNRGVLDVVVANQKGPLLVYKNTVVKENQWIQFELEGTKCNKSAIGARVRLSWNGQEQLQEVSGGNAYASQNQRRLHFGLGKNAKIEKAVIEWPSGQTQTIKAPKAGILHKVKEPK